jgi:hypothetical protein
MKAKAVLRCLTLLALMLAGVARPAIANGPAMSIEGGWSFMGLDYTVNKSTAAAFVEALFDDHPIGSSAFTWASDVTAGWISGRDYPSEHYQGYTTRDDIWLIAGGLRFHYGDASAWYRPLFFSLQPTLHSGQTVAESGNYEFTLTLGWQAAHWMLGVRHSSNADLHGPNVGETMLVGGITF